MSIQNLPNPLSVKLYDDTGMPVDITGIPAEDLVMTIKEYRGNGKFVILNPFMGHITYAFSKDDLAQEGTFSFGRDDGVAGPAIQYKYIVDLDTTS